MVNVASYTEAERSVIGAALADPNTLRFSVDECGPDDFLDQRLAVVYATCLSHYFGGKPVDEITIAKAVADSGTLGVDPVMLFDLRSGTPVTSNAGYYARIVREGAVRRRLRAAATRMLQLADMDSDLNATMTAARGEWEAVHTALGTGMKAKTLGEILAGSDEYQWLIPNLLERRDRVIITGGEGAGKSTFVRQVGIMSAAGVHPTLGTSIDPIRVLAVDAENTEVQWRRAARTLTLQAKLRGSANPEENLRLACSSRLDITTDRDLGNVHRLIDEHQPDMLMIGPLYRLIPRAINSDDDAAPLIVALDSLRDRGVAMVMEAHAGHAIGADGNRNLRPRGSAALLGWPEFGLGIAQNHDDESGTLFHLVRWRGDRDERAWPRNLRRGGAWPWEDDNPVATREHIRRLVARRDVPDHAMRAAGDREAS